MGPTPRRARRVGSELLHPPGERSLELAGLRAQRLDPACERAQRERERRPLGASPAAQAGAGLDQCGRRASPQTLAQLRGSDQEKGTELVQGGRALADGALAGDEQSAQRLCLRVEAGPGSRPAGQDLTCRSLGVEGVGLEPPPPALAPRALDLEHLLALRVEEAG